MISQSAVRIGFAAQGRGVPQTASASRLRASERVYVAWQRAPLGAPMKRTGTSRIATLMNMGWEEAEVPWPTPSLARHKHSTLALLARHCARACMRLRPVCVLQSRHRRARMLGVRAWWSTPLQCVFYASAGGREQVLRCGGVARPHRPSLHCVVARRCYRSACLGRLCGIMLIHFPRLLQLLLTLCPSGGNSVVVCRRLTFGSLLFVPHGSLTLSRCFLCCLPRRGSGLAESRLAPGVATNAGLARPPSMATPSAPAQLLQF